MIGGNDRVREGIWNSCVAMKRRGIVRGNGMSAVKMGKRGINKEGKVMGKRIKGKIMRRI